jgi:hypothetical protein
MLITILVVIVVLALYWALVEILPLPGSPLPFKTILQVIGLLAAIIYIVRIAGIA